MAQLMTRRRSVEYGRMYTTTTEEADQDVVIITSTFLNHSAPTVVLFDSGNTDTFLSRVFVDEIGVMIDD